MSGAAVIAAYHDLWKGEASFRMTKSDLRARPVFHHQREAIEAHLSVAFAALAITHYLTDMTGVSIKTLMRVLRPLRTVTIDKGGHRLTAQAQPGPEAADLLTKLPPLMGQLKWQESDYLRVVS